MCGMMQGKQSFIDVVLRQSWPAVSVFLYFCGYFCDIVLRYCSVTVFVVLWYCGITFCDIAVLWYCLLVILLYCRMVELLCSATLLFC